MKRVFLGSLLTASLLYANELAEFDLGEIKISDKKDIKTSSIELTNEEFELHNQEDISEALSSTSGVFLSNMGGRNEKTISIRGFDSKRVSVYLDGIPISAPYDGNFDYARFLTSDLSKISVSKGFSSAMYGANTMAGVVNMVSKRPTKEFEGDISFGLGLDNDGNRSYHTTAINLGSRQDKFYVQFSGSTKNRDHFNLSNDFETTSEQPTKERLRSSSEDTKGSLKLGFTPSDNSEYAIVYSKQHAKKEQPPVTDKEYSRTKYWDWPKWDKESIYFISNNYFKNSYLKTRLYYDKYENALNSYDDITYSTQNKKYAFSSSYDDYAVGGTVEYGYRFVNNELKASIGYKSDVHKGYDSGELNEDYKDETISLALEDIYSITNRLTLITGASYDILRQKRLYDADMLKDSLTKGDDAHSLNPQVGLFYDITEKQKIGFSIARKTHLPTMKERYSRKLGRALPNANLDAEKATHYELSYSNFLTNNFNFKTNLFLVDIKDAIEKVDVGGKDQNQNVGDFRHTGVEFEASYYTQNSESGLNYTYIDIDNRNDNGVIRLGIPRNSIFLYTKYDFTEALSYYANLKYLSGQYSQNGTDYFKSDSFVTVDTKIMYEYKDATFEIGVKNLFDRDYEYTKGFPETGREYFANLRYRF